MEYNISIIIPIYNVAQYIERCLNSVTGQTVTDGIECILVDDCGPDNSLEIAERYVQHYKGNIKFHIIRHEQNKGLSGARNTGIDHATGEYLYFMDSDDEITPDCMEQLYGEVVKYGKVDLVQGAMYETVEEKDTPCNFNISEHTTDLNAIKTFLLTYNGYIIPAQNRLVKRELVLQHKLHFREGIIHEDNYWTFFLAKYVKEMCYCSSRTYYHRYNPGSITKNINIAKENLAYKTIVTELSNHIDSFLPGTQKEYILYNLITAIDNDYLDEITKRSTIASFLIVNSFIEKTLLKFYFTAKNSFIRDKALHLLLRIYKL